MQTLPNEIVLRPRFQRNVSRMKEKLLEDFEVPEKAPFLVKRLNEHVFIKFDKTNNYFWSRLHLEINTLDTNRSRVYGVFGPNPTFRTFFVFFHFGIALLLAILGIWAYSNPTLKSLCFSSHLNEAYGFFVDSALYFWEEGRRKGKPQMMELYQFMMQTLNK